LDSRQGTGRFNSPSTTHRRLHQHSTPRQRDARPAYPAIATALAVAAEVIKEHGLDVDENYAGHRGLL
jgi:hypothetical protein